MKSTTRSGNLHDVIFSITGAALVADQERQTRRRRASRDQLLKEVAELASRSIPCRKRQRSAEEESILSAETAQQAKKPSTEPKLGQKEEVDGEKQSSTAAAAGDTALDDSSTSQKKPAAAAEGESSSKLADATAGGPVEKSAREQLQELRSVYLFGLQQVSLLTDLREAPDAILPGNFPPSA